MAHQKDFITAGKPIGEAKRAIIFLHGRGATAESILTLASYLRADEFYQVAPQATNETWYPYSFLAPPEHNEPWLSSALTVLEEIVDDLQGTGFTPAQIYFAGFSQGACLTLEFAARNAQRWGGVIAFTGGLIGDKVYKENYRGDLDGTPVFIGTSDPDMHVPVERVLETEKVLKELNGSVRVKIYPHMGHTISDDEFDEAKALLAKGQ